MQEQKIVNPSFAIFFAANNHDNCRFGIATPKKLIKLATERNFYKRQIKGMLVSHLKSEEKKQADGCQTNAEHCHSDLVIIIRYPYLKNDFATNQKNLYELLGLVDKRKINPEAKDKLSKKTNNIWRKEEKSPYFK